MEDSTTDPKALGKKNMSSMKLNSKSEFLTHNITLSSIIQIVQRKYRVYLHSLGVFTPIVFLTIASVVLGLYECHGDQTYVWRKKLHKGLLVYQTTIMAVIMYRSSDRGGGLVSILKCVLACGVICLTENGISMIGGKYNNNSLVIFLLVWFLRFALVYAQMSISLYMYHRFIWHAHWSAKTKGFDRWLWDVLRANYWMHYIEHHAASRDSPAKLAKMERVCHTEEEILAKYSQDWLLRELDKVTDRGITIRGPVAIMSAFMFFSILPAGVCSTLRYIQGDFTGGIFHLIGAAWILWSVMINHDKYHIDEDTLEKYAETSKMGWFWGCAEMKRIIREHRLHHDGKNHNRYFNVVHFDSFFIYPIWPEEHLRTTIHETLNAIVKRKPR